MAKTSYRSCWWLIQAVAGEFGKGSFRNGTGYTMWELNNLRPVADRLMWKPVTEVDKELDEEYLRDKTKFQKNFHNWRAIIYNEFGLVIMMESTSGPDHHGNGGYYYYLANPDLLDKGGESLRDHIKFLAESETKRDYWVSVEEMTKLYKSGSSTMGFISTGGSASRGYLSNSNTTPRFILGEENLPLVQFAMEFGEVLTIKFGKVREGIGFDDPYSFEPYQVKEIEGRWYVIGNLYPMGHKEAAELAVYELARLEFAYDEENPDLFYKPIKNFEVDSHIILGHDIRKKLGDVFLVEVDVDDCELLTQLRKYPLCSSQEDSEHKQLYITSRLSKDLIVQFGAYGDEIYFKTHPRLIWNTDDEELMEEDEKYVTKALNYFRNPQEKE